MGEWGCPHHPSLQHTHTDWGVFIYSIYITIRQVYVKTSVKFSSCSTQIIIIKSNHTHTYHLRWIMSSIVYHVCWSSLYREPRFENLTASWEECRQSNNMMEFVGLGEQWLKQRKILVVNEEILSQMISKFGDSRSTRHTTVVVLLKQAPAFPLRQNLGYVWFKTWREFVQTPIDSWASERRH